MPRLEPWELPSLTDCVVALAAVINGALVVAVWFVAAVMVANAIH